jgi:hypothetical protein
MIRIEGEDERGKGGRKARPVEYTNEKLREFL